MLGVSPAEAGAFFMSAARKSFGHTGNARKRSYLTGNNGCVIIYLNI